MPSDSPVHEPLSSIDGTAWLGVLPGTIMYPVAGATYNSLCVS